LKNGAARAVTNASVEAVLTSVVRDEAGRLTAALVRLLGDFALAEDLVQDAVVAALEHWPVDGLPTDPTAWLLATARRRGIDHWRRQRTYEQKLALLVRDGPSPEHADEVDDRLRLIFTCCHPALSREARLALTLRAVIGLTTREIARGFLTTETAIAQRIVRAKRKIVEAGIPYRVPDPDRLAERLNEVLGVVYLVFNEGYLATVGSSPDRRDLADDAEWLARLIVHLLPDEPESAGLLALIRLHRARRATRFDRRGRVVLLRDQDRSRWDHQAIAEASALVLDALRAARPGPYQIQAAIAACHAEAASWEQTDWRQILLLYDVLLRFMPTAVVRLNRAIALSEGVGPAEALVEVDRLEAALSGYHLFHATRGELLRRLSRPDEARLADERALELTTNPGERLLLEERLAGYLPHPDEGGIAGLVTGG
jgi:RNA polymerase sigma factor (sigma-70 family)